MGIEPTTDIVCPPLDLKSRRPTRTCPLPTLRLKDVFFEVNGLIPFSTMQIAAKKWDLEGVLAGLIPFQALSDGRCHISHFTGIQLGIFNGSD